MSKYRYIKKYDLEKLKFLAERAEKHDGRVVWATHTCWWFICCPAQNTEEIISCEPKDIPYRTRGGEHHLPCDPRGSVLLQSYKPTDFIKHAEENVGHYGKHGIEAFVAAFHGNIVCEKDDRELPTSFEGWDKYNEIIDEAIAKQKEKPDGK